MDGYVTIGTRLDTKELEKDLKNAERQLKQYEKESEKLTEQKLKVETEVQEYERQKQLIEEATDKRLKFAETEEQVNFVLGEEAIELSKLNEQYNQTFVNLENINNKIESNVRNQGLLNNKVSDLKGEINKVKGFEKIKNSISETTIKINEMGRGLRKVANSGIYSISKKIDNVGKSVNNVTKKILRWGLALFGIRTAYNFIRQSINNITQENEGIANQMNLMKNTVTTALKPAIETIISLIYTLFSFINSTIKELTGRDFFAETEESMKNASNSAKEINKQLAGFDEMNILSDNSSKTQFDTKGFVKENNKLLKILNKFKKMLKTGDWAGIGKFISKGIINGLNGLVEKIKSINWSSIGKKISVFLTNIDFSGILIGLVTVFGEALMRFQELFLAIDWPTIFANLGKGLANAILKINEYIKMIKWSQIGELISDTFTSVPWGDIGSSILNTIWDAMSGLLDLILAIDWGKVAKTISDSLKTWIDEVTKKIEETDWEKLGTEIGNKISDAIENVDWEGLGKAIIKLIIVGITAIDHIVVGLLKTFVKRILKKIGLNEEAQKAGEEFIINLAKGIEKALTAHPIKIDINFVTGIKKVLPFAKGGIVIPKLASGGVINQPGRGVPIGSAIGGERGMEGVIPLTDSQQMALLGEAIGKYITINANITNTMNGRVISREIQKINAENDFAFNS